MRKPVEGGPADIVFHVVMAIALASILISWFMGGGC